ncbi:protein involved in polysaccharide export with SLBB domain [Rhabdobacter roseus]|uniref:Protein involved in polysaccharide export with SLBB domain n=2 Tax=Rhabdobacter roseus TaxID=1655419 RepID=A0A840TRP6_9BACT|nr:protein involved in polysaccharide export with SLBB domain [Rhabdobacter roseus]
MRFHSMMMGVFLLLAGSGLAVAQNLPNPSQLSNSQLLQYYQKAKASGMSDMQIEQAAMAQGFTLDDIAKLRRRLTEEQDGSGRGTFRRDTVSTGRSLGYQDLPTRADTLYDSLQARRMRIFGASFFANASLTFEPNLRMATPRNYILGPDDELIVDIYGNAVDNYRLKVSPEGTVKMLNLAPVYVNGLTIEQASERIVARLRQAFSSLNRPGGGTYANITLGDVRSIKVIVTGDVMRPGTYTVSSLASAFNVLYLSGGPTENGSFRRIEVIRNNNVVSKLDLYKFLVNADLKDNISLQDQDIIMIYPYQARVELLGEVKRPGIFEAHPGDTFGDLLHYAGGYTSEAYTASVRYRRNTPKEWRMGQIAANETTTFVPQNGDRYEIGKILDRYENVVAVRGAVYRPGDYALEPGTSTVRQLLAKAEGLREEAFLNRALLHRFQPNMEPSILAFDLGKLMRGETEDIPLQRQDSLVIKSVQELREAYSVSIAGAVNKGGQFLYSEGMTVSDLIYLAGGYTEGGVPYRVEVSRRVKEDTVGLMPSQNTRIFTFDVQDDLAMADRRQRFVLQPFDLVFIRKSPRYEAQKTVVVEGEVRFPGRYTIDNNTERITDLIRRAGGLKSAAYLSGARLTRKVPNTDLMGNRFLEKLNQNELLRRATQADGDPETAPEPPQRLNRELVGLDMASILQNPALPSNVLVQDGDSLIIPRIVETVRIIGEVLNPSIVNYDPAFRFKDYIAQAGGYTDNARKSKVFVSYANGRLDRTKRFLFFHNRPEVVPGTTVNVPAKPIRVGRETTPGERVAILSLLGTLVITLIRLF